MIGAVLSLWLVPQPSPVRDRFEGVIAGLAAELGTVPFQPHVTVLGELTDDAMRARGIVAALAATLGPQEVVFDVVGHEPVHFRSMYLRAAAAPEVLTLHRAAAEAFEFAVPGAYMPHLSLLYSDLPDDAKPPIQDRLGVMLPTTIGFDRLALWHTTPAPTATWTCDSEYPLGARVTR